MESHQRGRSRESPTKICCRNITLLLRQFLLLLGKNFLLQIRRPIGTVFEIIIPIVAIGVLVAFRLGIPSLGTTKQCFQTFGSDPITLPAVPSHMYYAPNNTQEIQALASYVTSKLSDSNITLIGVATEDELVSVIQSNDDENEFCGTSDKVGIVFDNINQSDIQYSIRMSPDKNWRTDATYPVFQFGARVDDVPYFTAGFMQLEKIIDESIIEWKTGSPFTLNVDVRQFPFPDYNQNVFLEVLNIVLPLFIVIALMFSVGVFVKELVLEKESRMKETMRMMGLSNWILVSTWFIKQLLFYLIIIIIMTLLLKFGKIYPRSDFFLLFLLLMFYFMAAIAFSFLVSVWFSSARLGMFAGFVIWFLSFVPFFFLDRYTIPFGGEMGASVISNLCIAYAVKVLSVLEVQEDGLQFSNIGTPLSVDDQLSMGWLMLMLLFDTILYLGLYWYIDAVKPGKYGTPKPFYFLFLPSFWLGNVARRRVNSDVINSFTNPVYDASAHEAEPGNLEVGIAIDELTKIYNRFPSRNRKTAVDSLSLNMYKGQITALLGHNGAGKTTIMSILTGLYTPTTGSAYINGYNVLNDMGLIRRSLGICPQHNVLFDRLTVSEHLIFFSMLKGIPTSKVKAEVNRMITDLQLPDKRSTRAKKLSGGMKRKLSVGIALVGQSEIVILDEPTSGMDPYARRATWDLLIKHKEGRTILLTTHFMDEADLLGDRIAIMADGRLKCSGSSLFLKTRFGIGYHMTIVKEPGCNSGKVIDVVKKMVTESEAVTDVGAELSFILPSQSKNQFPELFDILESERVELGVSSFGVSITTMEEVFIKVGLGEDATLQSKLLRSQPTVRSTQAALEQSASLEMSEGQDNNGLEEEEEDVHVSFEGESSFLLQDVVGGEDHVQGVSDTNQYGKCRSHPYTLNKGVVLWFQQVFATFVKHLYHATRFWPSIIWQIIVPLFFVILCLALAASQPDKDTNNAARLLTVKNTAPSKTIDFFWANLGGVTSPIDFKSSDAETMLGVSSFHEYSDDIDRIKQQVSNYSSINQCCSYQYQILDKFCASRTTGEYYSQCRDQESFGYSACTSCIGCNYNQHKSCTNPDDNSNTGCPLSPPISYADLLARDQLQGSLDDYNTYVAEQLLDISGSLLNPNAFFRLYQGGFVVHPETYTYSTCGCVGEDAIACSSLSPTLKYNYPSEDHAEFLDKSIELFNDDISCYQVFTITDTDCSDDANDWNHEYNWAVEHCIENKGTNCNCHNKTTCDQILGGITETPPSIVQPKVTVWYNNQPFHMAPAVLNSFYSLYLKKATGNTISVTNKPLPLSSSEQVHTNVDSTFLSSGFILSYGGVFGMCFLFSSFILFLVQERESKAKHIQFVSGVGATSYWIGTFLFDVVNALVPSILILITFAAFNVKGLRDENLAVVFILFFLSSWAAIPISYMFSFLFTNSLIGFSLLIMFHYFIFVILQVTTLLVSEEEQNILYYIFLLHPTYGLGNGLADMYTNQLYKDICTKNDLFERICRKKGYTYLDTMFVFKRPGVLWTFVYLFAEGLFFLFLTVLLERRFFIPELSSLFRSKRARHNYDLLQQEDPNEDTDVADERRKVHSEEQLNDNDVVIIKDLEKVYTGVLSLLCRCVPSCRNKSKRAVDGINLTVPAGECFGLLGVNGAGKTTTFNMLTGDLSLTNGSAKIAGHYISSQLHEVQKKIGYCPQFDAIIELLTGRELLIMFARLRGIPERHIKSAVQFEIDRLDLKQHANKRCGNYSGGNKRKLSTAIALIGNPPILFLDEPTTGMDPVTRRFLWDAITNIVREGQSVILTSHSMEECEALCSRLAIMVNGKFKCLGSTQHLKNKYGAGYVMEIRVAEGVTATDETAQQQVMSTVTAPVQMFIANCFINAVLLESHQESVTYQIPAQGVTWSSVFRTIEDNKERFNIINYTISQTTLDQVFINFAKEQEVVTGDYN